MKKTNRAQQVQQILKRTATNTLILMASKLDDGNYRMMNGERAGEILTPDEYAKQNVKILFTKGIKGQRNDQGR